MCRPDTEIVDGWDYPVTVTSAAGAAALFFNNLKGGRTVTQASSNLTANIAGNFLTGGFDAGQTSLDVLKPDDSIIIDQIESNQN